MRIDPAGWPFILGAAVITTFVWLLTGPLFGVPLFVCPVFSCSSFAIPTVDTTLRQARCFRLPTAV